MIAAAMLVVLLLVVATFVCLHEVGWDAEGRRALRRIEHGDSPARAGAEVMHAAAGAEALGDAVNGAGNLAELWVDRFERTSIFHVHQLDELE
jgi:hypothetical protein